MAKKTSFKLSNIKEYGKPQYTRLYIEAIITLFYTILVPSLFKLQGWVAYLVAYVVPFVVGGAMKFSGAVITSLVLGVGNIAYTYLDEPLKGIWAIKGDDATTTTTTTTTGTTTGTQVGAGDYTASLDGYWDGGKYLKTLNDLTDSAQEIDELSRVSTNEEYF